MWFNELKRYISLLVVGVILIAIYKTFDNFGNVIEWFSDILSLLTPFVIGSCISYILYRPCKKIEELYVKTKVNFFIKYKQGFAVATIYLIFVGIIILALVAIIPSLTESITDFMEQLPYLIKNAVERFNSLGIYTLNEKSILKIFDSNILSIDKLLGGFSFDNMSKYAKNVMNVGSWIFTIFMGIVISVYILLDRQNLKKAFLRLTKNVFPEKFRGIVNKYSSTINEFISLYIQCQLVDALIIFVLSLLALTIMGTKYAPVLALMVGSFNLIPYFGAITATIVAAIITAFTDTFTAGIIVAVVLIVLQQVDANFIQPKLVSGSLNVKPIWVIFGILVGGGMFGVLGIFLAVPFLALLRIIIIDILERRENKVEVNK